MRSSRPPRPGRRHWFRSTSGRFDPTCRRRSACSSETRSTARRRWISFVPVSRPSRAYGRSEPAFHRHSPGRWRCSSSPVPPRDGGRGEPVRPQASTPTPTRPGTRGRLVGSRPSASPGWTSRARPSSSRSRWSETSRRGSATTPRGLVADDVDFVAVAATQRLPHRGAVRRDRARTDRGTSRGGGTPMRCPPRAADLHVAAARCVGRRRRPDLRVVARLTSPQLHVDGTPEPGRAGFRRGRPTVASDRDADGDGLADLVERLLGTKVDVAATPTETTRDARCVATRSR